MIALLATAMLAGVSPPRDGRSIDDLRDRIARMLGPRAPGVGVALVDRHGIVWVGGIGLADVATKRAATADTLFRAASVAKTVTAVAVMQLVERGLLSLDARLAELAPEVGFENRWESTHPIRVAHLLEHTAGFDESHFNEQWDDHAEPRTMRQLVEINPAARRARWPPGTMMSYSNEDYLVVGYLIEKLTGRPYDAVVRDGVFVPLHMDGARFWRTPDARPLLAQGYDDGKPIVDEEQMIRPAVNLIVSARDLAAYLQFWIARGGDGAARLLSSGSIDRIETCRTLPYPGPEQRYGLGNDLDQIEGHLGRGHLGVYEGFAASLRYFPREGVGFGLLFNSNDPPTRIAVEREALHFLMGGQAPQPSPTPPMARGAPGELAGTYRVASVQSEIFAFTSSIDLVDVDAGPGWLVERPFRRQGLVQRLFHESPRELLPLGSGEFRAPEEVVSSRYFLRTRDATAMVTPTGYLEQVRAGPARIGRSLFFSAMLVLFSALPIAVVRLALRVVRRRPSPPHLAARVFPVLASTCFFVAYALLSRSPQRWGRLNLTTLGACVLSWAFALLAVAALYFSFRAPGRVIGCGVKLHCMLVSSAAVGLSFFFWRAHWIGIRLWTW